MYPSRGNAIKLLVTTVYDAVRFNGTHVLFNLLLTCISVKRLPNGDL